MIHVNSKFECVFMNYTIYRFGLFGLKEEIPGNVNLNYIAVALAVCRYCFRNFISIIP